MRVIKFFWLALIVPSVFLLISPCASQDIEPSNSLINQLGSEDIQEVRAANQELIVAFGYKAIPKLIHALTHENWLVRGNSALALGEILVPKSSLVGVDPMAEEAIPSLKATLSDERWEVRISAATALVLITVETDTVMPVLVSGLKRPEPQVRKWAARALGQLGSKAKATKSDLISALDPKSPGVCVAVTIALQRIDPHVSNLRKATIAFHSGKLDLARIALEQGTQNKENEIAWLRDVLRIFSGAHELKESEIKKRLPKIVEAAESGNPVAQHFLAKAYKAGDMGIPAPEATKLAVKWLKRAAQQGLADAQSDLGDAYFAGVGVAKSLHEAIEWFEKAANQGHAEAQYRLGDIHFFGYDEVPVNKMQAYKWLTIAMLAGDSTSAPYVREMLLHSGMSPEQLAKGDRIACDWFLESH